jgi:zona occludens toxin (predicted ATPase)
MAISLISGLPGTGKTLSGIKRFLLPALKECRKVYTNIDGIQLLKTALYLGAELQDLEKLLIHTEKFSTKLLIENIDANSLVIIDEAQVYWNNRDYASDENKKLLPFLQKHRHYGLDIVFLTQNIDQLDIGIRRLCQVHYRLNTLTNMGLSKVIKVKVFPDAMGSEQFKPIASLAWKIDSGIFPLYQSYEGGEVKEADKKAYNVFLRSPLFIFSAIAFVLCVVFAVRNTFKDGNFFLKSAMQNVSKSDEKDFSKFDLGEYDEYYCGDKFYVLREGGKVDTLRPKDVPPSYCPHINFNFQRVRK